MAYKRLFTSESVTEGHPDKLADQISDAVLDALLTDDPYSRVAVETFAITGQIHIAGEVTTKTYVDIPKLAREVVRDVGYTRSAIGFDAETCGVSVSIDEQSPDIALGVDRSLEARAGDDDEFELIGAGDQGMMFGYACRETEELMPLPIVLAHNLTRHLAAVRKNGDIPYLRPDGKSQVTVEYDGDRPVRVEAVVVSTQHDPEIPLEEIRREITENVIDHVIPGSMHDDAHARLRQSDRPLRDRRPEGRRRTDRDARSSPTRTAAWRATAAARSPERIPTKVDRSGAYAARWVAKNIVARGTRRSLRGAGRVCDRRRASDERLGRDLRHRTASRRAHRQAPSLEIFDLRPAAIIHHLQSAPPDLQADGVLRPLRPPGSRSAVGATRPRRRAAQSDRF